MSAPTEGREVVVAGRLARYSVAGEGEPVVMIHGLSGSTRWWRPIVPRMAEHYRVFLINLPGFGRRRGRHHVPVDRMADWVRSWAAAVGIEQAHLLGHSMGGVIALQIAAQYPELVNHLVLVAPAVVPERRRVTGYALPLVRSLRGLPLPFLPVLATDALRAGPITILRTAREMLRQDVSTSLGGLETPALLIWGEDDLLVPRSVGQILAAEMPHARLVTLPRAGHVPMYDAPEEFAGIVLAFLSEGM